MNACAVCTEHFLLLLAPLEGLGYKAKLVPTCMSLHETIAPNCANKHAYTAQYSTGVINS